MEDRRSSKSQLAICAILKPYTRKVVGLRSYLQFLEKSKSGRRLVTLITLLALVRIAITISQAFLVIQLVTDATSPDFTVEEATPALFALASTLVARSFVAFALERYSTRGGQFIRSEIRNSLLKRVTKDDPMTDASRGTDEISILVTQEISSLDPFFSRTLPQLLRAILIPVNILALIAIAISNVQSGNVFATVLVLLILAPEVYLPIRVLKMDSHILKKATEILQQVSQDLVTPMDEVLSDDVDEPAPSLGRVKEIRWTDCEVLHDQDGSATSNAPTKGDGAIFIMKYFAIGPSDLFDTP